MARRWDELLKPTQVGSKWQEVLRQLPGYNSIATAGDCRFDEVAADAALDFFPRFLRHVEGQLYGQPFQLELWQKSFVASLIGWKRLDEQGRVVRRYRESLLYVARKNGKTPLAAGVALLILFGDSEHGQQDYLAAGEREQAGLLFRHCRGMVEQSPALSSRAKAFGGTAAAGQSKSMVKADGSFLKVVSADAQTKHGGNTHLAIIDELHVQPNRDLVDVFQTSMASANRRQPLLVFLTTADFSRPSICNEKYDYACKVRDGIIDDPTFLPAIWEAGREDDWTLEETWRKANPNLGVSVSLEFLRQECKKAQETPAYENTFRRLHLNQRTETDVRAIPMERWDAISKEVQADSLAGRECFGGLDLSTTTDLSACVLLFPDENGGYDVLTNFWAPEEGAKKRENRDRVPYLTWQRQGFLTLTTGDVIDYDVIRRDLNLLREKYNIKELACDRWNATQLITQLMGDGWEVVAYGQGYRDMTAPTKEMLKLVIEGKLRHGGHPVLRWMASNLATETDAAGNLKPSKKKSTERIDGMVALIMALGRALVQPVETSGGIEVWG